MTSSQKIDKGLDKVRKLIASISDRMTESEHSWFLDELALVVEKLTDEVEEMSSDADSSPED